MCSAADTSFMCRWCCSHQIKCAVLQTQSFMCMWCCSHQNWYALRSDVQPPGLQQNPYYTLHMYLFQSKMSESWTKTTWIQLSESYIVTPLWDIKLSFPLLCSQLNINCKRNNSLETIWFCASCIISCKSIPVWWERDRCTRERKRIFSLLFQ